MGVSASTFINEETMDDIAVGLLIVGAGIAAVPFVCTVIVYEGVLAPVSIPLSIKRTKKYNKWIKEWEAGQTPDTIKICKNKLGIDALTYQAINSSIPSMWSNQMKRDQRRYAIPKCLWQANRRPWKTMPSQADFNQKMDEMVERL